MLVSLFEPFSIDGFLLVPGSSDHLMMMVVVMMMGVGLYYYGLEHLGELLLPQGHPLQGFPGELG